MTELFKEKITLAEGQTFHLHLGKLRLHCTRLATEWQISQYWEETDLATAETRLDYIVPKANADFRYMVGKTKDYFNIKPKLANMNVVVRPVSPILIPKSADVTFYISTTLWVEIVFETGKNTFIHEVPVQIDSETWFGLNNYEGELCYSSSTHARMHFNALALHQGRIITALKIKNKTDKTIQVDRLNVPVRFLCVYQDEKQFLCTNDVSVELEGEKEDLDINIQKTPNSLFGKVSRLSDSRESIMKGVFKKAVATFF